jgi:hypothetical protein
VKRWQTTALFAALAAGFAWGALQLFESEFSGGQVYPQYSSLRADPYGAKLLYASLGRLPGVRVTRNFAPLTTWNAKGATVILLSANPLAIGLEEIEKWAKSGNHVLMTLPDDYRPDASERWSYRHWHVKFPLHVKPDDAMYFTEADGWKVLEADGIHPTAIERAFGTGAVVLVARSEAFSNGYLADTDDVGDVTNSLGAPSQLVFDETHLGVTETGSVVGLAKRFRLTGFAVGLALLAILFIWRNAGAFPPAANTRAARRGGPAASGLRTLLHKHLPPNDLIAACWKEWLATHTRSHSAERLRRAEAAVRDQSGKPLQAAREIYQALHAKGDF